MVFLDGEKMSKSLGNMVFVGDLVEEYGADALRLYLAGCHYREDLIYDEQALAAAAELARRLAGSANRSSADDEQHDPLDSEPFRRRFEERMSDDLDTPAAIQVLSELAEAVDAALTRETSAQAAQELLRELGGVLGLRLEDYQALRTLSS
jgi:L-cysteine:1D-myo-inositol 2-amino-2-deoxy-alpha-D-glucopyranoside ligase